MLDSKNKQFQTIVKSIDSEEKLEPGDFIQKMADLNSRFDRISSGAQDWQGVSF